MPLDFLFAAKAIGTPVAEFLLKHFLGELAAGEGKGLIEIAAKAAEDGATQNEARLRFEDLGHKVVKRLQPLFIELPSNSAEAVALQLGETLSKDLSVEFLVEKDLDPVKLAAAFRQARPLPNGMFGEAERALYDRALDEAVRYIIGIANSLPRFEPAAFGTVLGRLSRMGDEFERILASIAEIENALVANKDEAVARANRFEADYRQAVIRNLDFLELFGADISEEARRHRLSVGYISVTISADTNDNRETVSANRISSILAAGSGRILIRGEAGSGKSTLLRWIAIGNAALSPPKHWTSWFLRTLLESSVPSSGSSILKDEIADTTLSAPSSSSPSQSFLQSIVIKTVLSSRSDTVGTRLELEKKLINITRTSKQHIPFLVRLRDCPEGKLPTPDNLPIQIARELGNPPPEWVRSVLESGRGLLMLDGVDEVPNHRRGDILSDIRAILSQYPKCWYIVTTRPTAVGTGWLKNEDFSEAEINPLSDADRSELIRRWHRAVEDELSRQGRWEDLKALEDHLIRMLAESPALARLATNPLLCAVMCALHRDRRQVLPESQGELCELICELLLHRREAEAGISLVQFPKEYSQLKYKQKRAVLQTIAHHMVDNEESTAAVANGALGCVERTLRDFPSVDESSAAIVLKALVERSGMLRERRPGVIDFIHNTLRDFLSAEVFVEDDDVPKLARHSADDGWRQVVRFASATDNRTFASRLIERILNDADQASDPEMSRRLRLAAVDCRYSALNLSPPIVSRVGDVERSLVPPQTMTDAEALAASGDAVVPLLHYRQMNEESAAASVRALRLVGTDYAQLVLKGYFGDRRPAVVDELTQAVNPLFLEVVREQLEKNGKLSEAIARQISDLGPIASMSNLEQLDLTGWDSLHDIAPLAELRNLKQLTLPRKKRLESEAFI